MTGFKHFETKFNGNLKVISLNQEVKVGMFRVAG